MDGEERRGEERKGRGEDKERQVWAPSVSMQFVNVSTASHMRLAANRPRHGAFKFFLLLRLLLPYREIPLVLTGPPPHLLSGDGVGLVQIVRLHRSKRQTLTLSPNRTAVSPNKTALIEKSPQFFAEALA